MSDEKLSTMNDDPYDISLGFKSMFRTLHSKMDGEGEIGKLLSTDYQLFYFKSNCLKVAFKNKEYSRKLPRNFYPFFFVLDLSA